MLAYLAMMAPRLVELHRVLKPTGSLYLHCDPTASHYLKLLLDAIFGPANFQNEVIWSYKRWTASKHRLPRLHDVILFYTKGKTFYFKCPTKPNDTPNPSQYVSAKDASGKTVVARDDSGNPMKRTLSERIQIGDVWDLPILSPVSKERLGYPTQKPLVLLDRIIEASSQPGDVVLDPFCGCGTAVVAAQRLGREWIGVDITHLAVGLIRSRLRDVFGQSIETTYDVTGEPQDLAGAEQLASEDKFQFEAWALGLVGARPAQGKPAKKGPDGGVDGRLYFHDDKASGDTKQIVISVKGGKSLKTDEVRALEAVRTREKAQVGVLISLATPTPKMRADAASAGFYDSPFGSKHPCIQLITVEELLNGRRIDYPAGAANVTITLAVASAQEQVEGQMDLGD